MNAAALTVGLLIGGAAVWVRQWRPPERAEPYLTEIAKAERTQGLPRDLLARLLYQESRYRTDIISGKVASGAGALGIAQIVPKWHPNVDPLDPVASIHYAARYLKSLKDRFGSWRLALAAYNWGPGNISKYASQPERWPEETQKYVADILGDLGVVA